MLGLTAQAKTACFPKGDTKVAWEALELECEPKTEDDLVNLLTELNNCELNAIKDESPASSFTELTHVCQMTEEVDAVFAVKDDYLKAQIIAGPPQKECSQTLLKHEEKLKGARCECP